MKALLLVLISLNSKGSIANIVSSTSYDLIMPKITSELSYLNRKFVGSVDEIIFIYKIFYIFLGIVRKIF